jgi:2,3,4,5-tetrahydropyridine-2-carboxylate N-succinyltransferase
MPGKTGTCLIIKNISPPLKPLLSALIKARSVCRTDWHPLAYKRVDKKSGYIILPYPHMEEIKTGPFVFHDKMKLKTDYKANGVRVVPHGIARYGAYLAKALS